MPIIHLLPPETSHNLAVIASKYKLIPSSKYKDDEILVSFRTTQDKHCLFWVITCSMFGYLVKNLAILLE